MQIAQCLFVYWFASDRNLIVISLRIYEDILKVIQQMFPMSYPSQVEQTDSVCCGSVDPSDILRKHIRPSGLRDCTAQLYRELIINYYKDPVN